MTATEIINEIQKWTHINLSIRERNWIKDNVIKRHLHIDTDNPIISFEEINTSFHTIIQNGKSKKLLKLDHSKFAIVVSTSGCCSILLPE